MKTRVELFSSLVIIAVLASTVAASRLDRSTAQCRNNLKQLMAAWSMYANDNRGRLVYNNVMGPQGWFSWVGGWLDFSASSDNTNVAMLIDHKTYTNYAYLGPYLQTARVFKCPEDKSFVRIAGLDMPRVRSYSLNQYLGGQSNIRFGFALLFTNIDQINCPSRTFTVLDERPESIHGGSFLCDVSTAWELESGPGFYHDGGGNLSFVDGHTETHRWKDVRTMPKNWTGFPLNLPGDSDITWLQHRAVGNPALP